MALELPRSPKPKELIRLNEPIRLRPKRRLDFETCLENCTAWLLFVVLSFHTLEGPQERRGGWKPLKINLSDAKVSVWIDRGTPPVVPTHLFGFF